MARGVSGGGRQALLSEVKQARAREGEGRGRGGLHRGQPVFGGVLRCLAQLVQLRLQLVADRLILRKLGFEFLQSSGRFLWRGRVTAECHLPRAGWPPPCCSALLHG
jgi:hypothetical protein